MRNVLLIQSRTNPDRAEQERINFTRAVGKSAKLHCLSALDETLAWKSPERLLKEYDGVIFGGSSDFDFNGGRDENDPLRIISAIILTRVHNLISYAIEKNFPLLGVCFGHQILAQMKGGEIAHDEAQSKFGSFEVVLTPEGMQDPLTSTLPKKFYAQYAHNDSATSLPEGATLLATGARCRFSALRYGKNVYTVQFHPEAESGDFAARLIQGGYLPNNTESESAVCESPEASKIVPLWIENVVTPYAEELLKKRAPRAFESKIGFENEAWLVRQDGDSILPVDASDLLETLNKDAPSGNFTREPGLGSIELVGKPESTVVAAANNIRLLHERAQSLGLNVAFCARSPYTTPVHVDPEIEKDRYKKLWAAAKEEMRKQGRPSSEWRRMELLNYFAALHMHVSFSEFEISKNHVHPRMIFVMNIMNYVGPRIARILCDKYGVDNTGHLLVCRAWADERRFPAYGRWFPTFHHFKAFFESITRLIRLTHGSKEHGTYEIDLKTHMKWGVRGEVGAGMWTFCRPRPAFGTIEIRLLPSWPVDSIGDVGTDLYEFVEFLISVAPEKPFQNLEDLIHSSAWEKISTFKVGGVDSIPSAYTEEMWQSDLHH